jgi:hypothetical protein
MDTHALATWLLSQEARAMRTRIAQIKPFALQESMLPAAALSLVAQVGIERFLSQGRRKLNSLVEGYIRWLEGPEGRRASPAQKQRGFSFLKLRFNVLVSEFDIFSDVITQRSEHETGVRLAGLDVMAADALEIPGGYFQIPPLMCYLDRGHGAAIRRARTRLPGGRENPVAIIRVPRERMVGSGIASSVVHEVGHQAAALLDLVTSLREELRTQQNGDEKQAWVLWDLWISEIVADFWSVAKLGIGSTLGLMGVVSLPKAFVFRISTHDPHPFPWIRVKLSAAMGRALYPHPQWEHLTNLWDAYYPARDLDEPRQQLIRTLEATIPEFVQLLIRHRPPSLRGAALGDAMDVGSRTPDKLAAYFEQWRTTPGKLRETPPSLVFAVLGQARANGRMTPERESRLVSELLTDWALRRALDASEVCAAAPAAALVRAAS